MKWHEVGITGETPYDSDNAFNWNANDAYMKNNNVDNDNNTASRADSIETKYNRLWLIIKSLLKQVMSLVINLK